MSKAFTNSLAALAACALFGCAGGAVIDESVEKNATEPTLWSGEATGATEEAPRTADTRDDIANANGATARTISYNHPEPHSLVIPATDLAAARGGTYTLAVGGGALGDMHTHDVTLTRQQFVELRDGATLTVETTAGGTRGIHTHTLTIARR